MPWRLKVAKSRRVPGMDRADWWLREGELPGIFRWAVTGLLRLTEQGGFTESDVCEEEKSEYRLESNPASMFLSEFVSPDEDGELVTNDAYKNYREWCIDRGYRPLSDVVFGKEIKAKYPTAEKKRIYSFEGKRVQGYAGISFEG